MSEQRDFCVQDCYRDSAIKIAIQKINCFTHFLVSIIERIGVLNNTVSGHLTENDVILFSRKTFRASALVFEFEEMRLNSFSVKRPFGQTN